MVTRIQVTLTVSEGKRLIALGINGLPEIQKALEKGKIFLKGGTTVSAVAEELVGQPLKISGRFTPRGARGSLHPEIQGHSLLIDQGKAEIIDSRFKEVVETLGPEDIIIIGANAIDTEGNAAMCIGAPFGGRPGEALSGLLGYGAKVIITVGLEKLIPGKIKESIQATGRNTIHESHGMALGLIPLVGKVFTEQDAFLSLADVQCVVVAKGGIDGAEGSTTFVITGEQSEVKKVAAAVNRVKGSQESGILETLPECKPGGRACGQHKGCIYRVKKDELTIE